MKIAILCRSDLRGGAAIVSFRLMKALRKLGIDARMLVLEKLSDSPFVQKVGSGLKIKKEFFSERLDIFRKNGFNRQSLFKIDTGKNGLPLWKNTFVREADAIILNWVNQAMLSIRGIKKIMNFGKPVIWTMHDCWNFTGICHHPFECRHFINSCGDCPLLGSKGSPEDLSNQVWHKKKNLYDSDKKVVLRFVAVSNWLRNMALESSLLGKKSIEVIGNALPEIGVNTIFPVTKKKGEKIKILFGAARIDDPIKGFDRLIAAAKILRKNYPDIAENIELITFGGIRDREKLHQIEVSHKHIGEIRGEEAIAEIYLTGDILVSASVRETLPTTLVEAQLYGCFPVSFNRGGQSDIIDHEKTGILVEHDDNIERAAENLAKGMAEAFEIVNSADTKLRESLRESVINKFGGEIIAEKYLELIKRMQDEISRTEGR